MRRIFNVRGNSKSGLRKMKKRLGFYITLLVVIVLLMPFPERINQTMSGTALSENDEYIEDISVHNTGWRFRFLIFKDRFSLKITIRTNEYDIEIVCPYSIRVQIEDNWYLISQTSPIYDSARNGFVPGGYVYMTDVGDEICLKGIETSRSIGLVYYCQVDLQK